MSLVRALGRLGCVVLACAGMPGCEPVEDITPRAYVAMLVADTLPLRKQIGGELLGGTAVTSAGPLRLEPSKPGRLVMPVDFGWVTAGGAVVTYSKEYGVTLVQEPRIVNGVVKWSCVVHPGEAKPSVCGDS